MSEKASSCGQKTGSHLSEIESAADLLVAAESEEEAESATDALAKALSAANEEAA